MAITIQPIRGVMVGSYGQTITLTVVDEDGITQDVSGYTTITIVARSPDARKTVTANGSYVTDGSDGQISFAFVDGDIGRSGLWNLQVEFETSTEIFKTRPTEMDVGQGLR
jgi:hypothetical protein